MADPSPDRIAAPAPAAAGASAPLGARGVWVTRSEASRRIGRGYFAAQSIAGALWWLSVLAVPAVREATLGGLDPVPVAILDLPLFVLASALAALLPEPGARWAVGIAVPWTVLVTIALAVYATATGLAGWGVIAMGAASLGGLVAWSLMAFGRIPAESALRGPLRTRVARPGSPVRQFGRTLLQIVGFWLLFLAVIPAVIRFFESRWGVGLEPPWAAGAEAVRIAGWAVLVLASALGLWAAAAMSLRGDGTPLPAATAGRLVIAGPYLRVRNPMALSGIAQAVGVGLILGSWLVVVYALCGAAYWNWLVRPFEEADLEARFGEQFTDYRRRVRCWVPW